MSAGNDFNRNTTNNDEWLTPRYITDAIGPFDLDPCSPIGRPWDTANRHLTIDDDGLSAQWEGRVWMNPPYGRETFKWIQKLSEHRDGGIALIFSRTETIGFHEHIWQKAHAVFFFKGRIAFCKVDGSCGAHANAPSCLVSYTEQDTWSIRRAIADGKITGKLVTI